MTSPQRLTIDSDDLSVEQILQHFYIVPDYQREYVWETKHVMKLLEDVREEFVSESGKLADNSEYFLGSMVVCKDPDDVFQLIDGQQRLTTIYVFLCAARDALVAKGDKPTDVHTGQLYSASLTSSGDQEDRNRLELQYTDSDGILDALVSAQTPNPDIKSHKTSAKNIMNAYKCARDFISEYLDNDPATIRYFVKIFTQRIKLIRIITPNIASALKVFETINDRGVGLNSMDLLKNLLFMTVSDSKKYTELKHIWETLIGVLEDCGEKPLRFLRYFVMSHYDLGPTHSIREDEIYGWLAAHQEECGIAADPIGFAKNLVDCANVYAGFLSCKDPYGENNRYLNNMTFLSGALRQQHILLLAGRHLPSSQFNQLCRAIEQLFFCYIVTREPTKAFEKTFSRWASDLRKCKEENDLDSFLSTHIDKDLKARSARFTFAFQNLTDYSIQRYRLKYILAKLTQYIQESAAGLPAHKALDFFISKELDIEHILPRTPSKSLRAAFDKVEEYNDYVCKLGNLTLLEKSIDAAISNKPYAEKIGGYEDSSLYINKFLANPPKAGKKNRFQKAMTHFRPFDHWDSKTIEERQEMLTKLAHTIWNIPLDDK